MDNNNMSLQEQSGDKTIIEHVLDVTNGNMVEVGVGEASIDPLHGTGAPQVLGRVQKLFMDSFWSKKFGGS